MSYTPRRRGTYPPLNSQSYYQDYHPSSRRPTVRSYTVRSSRGYESAHEAPRSSREHESAHEAPYSSYYNRRERRLSRRPRSQSTRQREYPYAFASEGARPSADDIKVTYDDPEDTRKHDNARDTRADETIEVEYETDSEEKRRRRRASKKKSRQEEDTSRSTKGRPYWEDPSEWWVREDGRFRMPPPPMGDHIVPAETEPEDDSANVDTNDDDHPQEAPESQRQTYPRYKTFIASKSSRGPLEKVQYSPSEAEGLGNWRLIDIEFKDVCYEDTMRGEMTRIPWTKARVPVNVKWDQQPVNSWLDHVPTVSIINDLFSDVPDEVRDKLQFVAESEAEAEHRRWGLGPRRSRSTHQQPPRESWRRPTKAEEEEEYHRLRRRAFRNKSGGGSKSSTSKRDRGSGCTIL